MSSETPAKIHHGSCLCGQIKYEVTGEPMFSVLCHCINCSKFSGSSMAWNSILASNQVKFTSGEDMLKTYEDRATTSGKVVHRKFCSNCGSSLLNTLPHWKEAVILTIGGIDEDVSERWKPTKEVFCKDRAKWLPDMGIECFADMPPQAKSTDH